MIVSIHVQARRPARLTLAQILHLMLLEASLRGGLLVLAISLKYQPVSDSHFFIFQGAMGLREGAGGPAFA